LEKLEWQRRADGTFYLERKLPNGISFSTKVVPDRSAVWFEMSLTNGTSQTLSDLRVQNCVMLAHSKGFEQQTNDNKVFAATKTPGSPYVAVHSADRTRWIISAWDPVHRPWANPPCPCLHSDPKFPDCEPGKTRYIRGLVTFHEGADIEAKFKELDAIGWRDAIPPESAEARKRRQERIDERRAGVQVICHRGASEFAHENTLEAYRATFELGADGNEIDIRETKDGVLVCFHDDILDLILAAYGDVSDYTWNELRRFRFRRPGLFGEHTRIPTLAEVFALHREHAGLMHLDIKRPGLDRKVADLLDRFDLWEHVIVAPSDNGAAIVKDARYQPLKYKTQLYSDHRDVDPSEIEKALKLDGTSLIVDDPRGCLVGTGRALGPISSTPVSPARQQLTQFESARLKWPDVSGVHDRYGPGPRREQFGANNDEEYHAARTSWTTARLCEDWIATPDLSDKIPATELRDEILRRIRHRDWRYHGIEAAAAIRVLVAHATPNAVDVARECLWLDDPALDKVRDPKFDNPRSWHDWRIKNIVFPLLESIPGEKSEKVCRDYLALSDEEARRIGPPQFDAAARTLLTIGPSEQTALELLKHRHAGVRNRAVKVCLQHAGEDWAVAALKQAAPCALAFIPPQHTKTPVVK
jgi:glycerophosphoryl diester phosphodiesterase